MLLEGIHKAVDNLKQNPESRKLRFIIELEQMHSFLDSFVIMYENMPEQIVRNTILNTAKTIIKKWPSLPTHITARLQDVRIDKHSQLPEFVREMLTHIGPSVRLSKNEMKAWIRVDPDFASLFTPEMIMQALQNSGITVGVSQEAVKDLLESQRFGEEILVAEGMDPKPGQNGRLDYCIDVNDLGKTPKQLADGSVSFKDITLYEYLSKGDKLADIMPPIPGETGYTVTNKPVHPVDVQEANIPQMRYAKLSDDGKALVVTEDCCVSKKFGLLNLEPTVRVDGSISYGSGNIDSNVSVLVTEGVNTDFSVQSKKDIVIHGIVEGAQIRSEGTITIKGGIQGKEKARIEAKGDIHTKLIRNASVSCEGDLYVASEILNSKIISDGKVVLSQPPAQIIGGEVEADLAIIADTIGSDMGVTTIIKLGGKTEEFQRLLQETEEQIEEQESRLDACQQLLQNLELHMSNSSADIEEMKKAYAKAKQMQSTVQDRLDGLYQEQEDLMIQLDESAQQSRSIKAKTTIWNGTKIIISGVELDIHEPTGPAMAVLSGEEISILPYSGNS